MPKQLDKTATKQLLRSPDTKVIHNPMMNIGWWVAIFILLSAWLFLLFDVSISDIDVLKTVLVILIFNGGWCVPYVIVCRRHAIALTKEGMYFSHVDTEDFRGPFSRRNLFVRWDEFTQLKLTQGPIMTFRVKGERYAFTVQDPLFGNGSTRAKKQQPFVEAICSYSGYIYHFQKGEGRTWQYLFASSGHTFDVEADATDWDTLQPVTP